MEIQRHTTLPEEVSGRERQRLERVYAGLGIEMVSALWWDVSVGWVMPLRVLHDDFFFLPMTNRLEARVAGTRAVVMPGQCMYVRSWVEHEATMPRGVGQMSIVAIHANLLPGWGGGMEQLVRSGVYDCGEPAGLRERLVRLVHLMGVSPALGQKMGEELVREWMAGWTFKQGGEGEEREPGRAVDPRVREALTMIHGQFQQPVMVEDMARHVRLGTVQFTKLFRRAMGVSPKAYLAGYRLAQAARLLRSGRESVKEVAYATGFTDAHYFHMAFKKRFGCTPVVYRRQGGAAV